MDVECFFGFIICFFLFFLERKDRVISFPLNKFCFAHHIVCLAAIYLFRFDDILISFIIFFVHQSNMPFHSSKSDAKICFISLMRQNIWHNFNKHLMTHPKLLQINSHFSLSLPFFFRFIWKYICVFQYGYDRKFSGNLIRFDHTACLSNLSVVESRPFHSFGRICVANQTKIETISNGMESVQFISF